MFKYFLFFFISISANAYAPRDLDVSTYKYNRYIKPQLRSILQDYKTLIFILNPQLKVLKESFNHKRTISRLEHKLKDKCYISENSNCFSNMEKISETLKKFKKSSYNKVDFEKIENLNLDQKLKAQNQFRSFYQEVTNAEVEIDNFLIEAKLLSPKFIHTQKIKHLLTNIITTFDLFVLESSDNRFQDDFTAYWSSFIKPVDRHILIRNNKDYFSKNINDLNIIWNALNIRLTKRNFPIPKQAKTLLNIMHNRWNNILKVCLITNQRR